VIYEGDYPDEFSKELFRDGKIEVLRLVGDRLEVVDLEDMFGLAVLEATKQPEVMGGFPLADAGGVHRTRDLLGLDPLRAKVCDREKARWTIRRRTIDAFHKEPIPRWGGALRFTRGIIISLLAVLPFAFSRDDTVSELSRWDACDRRCDRGRWRASTIFISIRRRCRRWLLLGAGPSQSNFFRGPVGHIQIGSFCRSRSATTRWCS